MFDHFLKGIVPLEKHKLNSWQIFEQVREVSAFVIDEDMTARLYAKLAKLFDQITALIVKSVNKDISSIVSHH